MTKAATRHSCRGCWGLLKWPPPPAPLKRLQPPRTALAPRGKEAPKAEPGRAAWETLEGACSKGQLKQHQELQGLPF